MSDMWENETIHNLIQTDLVYISIRSAQKYLIPVICFVGTAGNLLAIVTFRDRFLREKSCCLYLTSKCISDTLFLSCLFLVWLERVDVPTFHTHGLCQIIIFVTYICGFLSVWFVVFITAENYIIISHTARVKKSKMCIAGTAKCIILVLVICSMFVYNFPLWTTGIRVKNGTSGKCSLLEQYTEVNQGLTYVDTILTLVLPSLLVIFLMVAILCKFYEAFKRHNRLRSLGRYGRRQFLSKSPHGRIVKMLFAVSSVFILLHTPSHAIRLRILIIQFHNQNINPIEELKLQRIFELIYYINFSTNCLIYIAFGKTFRYILKQLFYKSMRCYSEPKTSPSHRLCSSLFPSEMINDKEMETICLQSIDESSEKHTSIVTPHH